MVITGKYWSIVLTLCGARVAAVAAQQALTEAPTGFDTPTLAENPGSQSVSNGIAEPAGDSFALDQQIYELTHDVNSWFLPCCLGLSYFGFERRQQYTQADLAPRER